MEIRSFILHLKSVGISVRLSGRELKLHLQREVTEEVLASVRERKADLIRYLAEKNSGGNDIENIALVPQQESYPLSHAQKRFWLLSQSAESSSAYNIPGLLLLEGKLDTAILMQSLKRIVDRHENLRTVFREDGEGVIRQFIKPAEAFHFVTQTIDLSSERDQQQTLAALFVQEQRTAFDLHMGPLLRTTIAKLDEDKHAFFYTMHHIISDGWSMEVLAKELIYVYNSLKQGVVPVLRALPIQYKDYASWQYNWTAEPVFQQHEQYWLEQFSGELPQLDLPSEKARPAVKTFNGTSFIRRLSPAVTDSLKRLCMKEGGTPFMGLLAGLNALFYRYTGSEDIILGSPVAGREHPELEHQIGLYINSLALRTRFSRADSFATLLETQKEVLLNAYAHQAYPYDMLITQLSLRKDPSRLPLFDIMVGMQNQASANIYDKKEGFTGLTVRAVEGMQTVSSQFDLSLTFMEANGELELVIIYNTDLFSERNISDLYKRFEALLQHATLEPDALIRDLAWLPEEEVQELDILSGLHDIAVPDTSNIVTRFEQQARLNPEAIAAIHGTQQLTYRELNERANQVAHYLKGAHGISKGDLVGLIAVRSAALITGLLGILKAGAGYVPIDAGYPAERINHMTKDTGMRVLLTEDNINNVPGTYASTDPSLDIALSDTAYIIYTSGSTGAPKGVVVTHANAAHFFAQVCSQYNSGPGSTMPFVASHSFDISLFQLLLPLLTGGTSLVVDRQTLDDLSLFSGLLQQATMIDTVPGVYNLLADFILDNELSNQFTHITQIFIGGDTIPDPLLKKLSIAFSKANIIVTYGPTEGTIFCTSHTYEAGQLPAAVKGSWLGRPLPGSQIWILDKDQNRLPVGVTGEICIGGAGVAAGYHSQPELTAEKFIAHPYLPGARLYRTGDLGRWTAEGGLEFMGRSDTQIKIRGFRIEMGEIERSLLSHPLIREAIVQAREDAGGVKYLAAYLVSTSIQQPSEIRSYLSGKLPDYMIPLYFVYLPQLPLTSNGKVDRFALPEPGADDIGRHQAFEAAGNEMEARMVQIWEEVLGRTGISIHDNFFEVGGDSIKSIQIVSRLRKYGYTLSVADILQYPTPAGQAQRTTPLLQDEAGDAVTGEVPLSPVQRMFLEHTGIRKDHFNQSVLLFSTDRIPEDAIRQIFGVLCAHHDALRLRFTNEEGFWRQQYSGTEDGFDLITKDWTDKDKETGLALMAAASQELQESMTINAGPLVKLGLFSLTDGDRLLIVVHHLVIDGISLQLLLEDLTMLYSQYLQGEELTLTDKTDSFKYWMEQQQAYAATEALLAEQAFWKTQAIYDADKLPTDHVIAQNLVKDNLTWSFSLSKIQSNQLLTVANKFLYTTVEDVLLTALGLSLNAVFGMRRIVVKMEGHGRQKINEQADISRTVGWFTSLYPVLIDIGHPDNLTRQLTMVRDALRAVPNKGIGYGILKYLSPREAVQDIKFDLEPEISFNYLGQFSDTLLSENAKSYFSFSTEYRGHEISEDSSRDALLEITGILFEGALSIQLTYNGKQFEKTNIEKLMLAYEEQLVNLITHCTAARQSPVEVFNNNGIN